MAKVPFWGRLADPQKQTRQGSGRRLRPAKNPRPHRFAGVRRCSVDRDNSGIAVVCVRHYPQKSAQGSLARWWHRGR